MQSGTAKEAHPRGQQPILQHDVPTDSPRQAPATPVDATCTAPSARVAVKTTTAPAAAAAATAATAAHPSTAAAAVVAAAAATTLAGRAVATAATGASAPNNAATDSATAREITASDLRSSSSLSLTTTSSTTTTIVARPTATATASAPEIATADTNTPCTTTTLVGAASSTDSVASSASSDCAGPTSDAGQPASKSSMSLVTHGMMPAEGPPGPHHVDAELHAPTTSSTLLPNCLAHEKTTVLESSPAAAQLITAVEGKVKPNDHRAGQSLLSPDVREGTDAVRERIVQVDGHEEPDTAHPPQIEPALSSSAVDDPVGETARDDRWDGDGQVQTQHVGTPQTPRARVKLYRLSYEGTWDDCGTGHVDVLESDGMSFEPSCTHSESSVARGSSEEQDCNSFTIQQSEAPLQKRGRTQEKSCVELGRMESDTSSDQHQCQISSGSRCVDNCKNDGRGENGESFELHGVGKGQKTGRMNAILRVVAESDGKVVLSTPICHATDTFYHLQGDTIISWTEPHPPSSPNIDSVPTEMALSFAEAAGCRDVYDRILRSQTRICATGLLSGCAPQKNHSSETPPSTLQECSHDSTLQQQSADHRMSPSCRDDSGSGRGTALGDDSCDGDDNRANEIGAQIHLNEPDVSDSSYGQPSSLVMSSNGADPGLAAFAEGGPFFDEADLSPSPIAAWTSADPIDEAAFGQDPAVHAALGPTSAIGFLGASHHLQQQQTQRHYPQHHMPHVSAANRDATAAATFSMPSPNRAGLEALAGVLSDTGPIHIAAIRERVVAEVAAGNFVSRLCDVFHQAEDLMDVDGLRMLYHIFRSLFVLGTNSVIEILVNDSNILSVIGALEYDPDVFPPRPTVAAGRSADTSPSDIRANEALRAVVADVDMNATPRTLTSNVVRVGDDDQISSIPRDDSSEYRPCVDKSNVSRPYLHSSSHTSSSSSLSSPFSGPQSDELPLDHTSLNKEQNTCSMGPDAILPSCTVGTVAAGSSSDTSLGKRSDREQNVVVPSRNDDSDLMIDVLARTSEDLSFQQGMKNRRLEAAEHMKVTDLSHLESAESPKCAVDIVTSSDASGTGEMNDGKASEGTLSSVGPTGCGVIRRHRDYLTKEAEFRSVVKIPDSSILGKIHQNYRVTYIKDVILPRALDDGALGSLLFINNVDIVMYFVSYREPLEELFCLFQSCLQAQRDLVELPCPTSERRVERDIVGETAIVLCDVRNEKKPGVRFDDEHERNGQGEHHVVNSSAKAPTGSSLDTVEPLRSRNSSEAMESSGGETEAHCEVATDGMTFTDEEEVPNDNSARCKNKSHAQGGRSARLSSKIYDNMLDAESKLPDVRDRGDKKHTESLRALLGFLNELCILAKAQQPLVRNKFHSVLRELGVLEVALEILKHHDETIRLLGSDILSAAVIQDPCDIRLHMLRNLSEIPGSNEERKHTGFTAHGRESPAGRQNRTAYSDADKAKGQAPWPVLRSKPIASANCTSIPSRSSPSCRKAEIANVADRIDLDSNSKTRPNSMRDIPGRVVGNESLDRIDGEEHHDSGRNPDKSRKVESIAGRDNGTSGEALVLSKGDHASSEEFAGEHATLRFNTSSSNDLFPLLGAMMDVLCNDLESGVFLQVLDLLRSLLDLSTMRSAVEKENFLDVFYERFVVRLLAPLMLHTEDDMRKRDLTRNTCTSSPSLKSGDCNTGYLCDLMSFCVLNHSFRMKYFVLGHDVAGKILKLLHHRRAHVRLASLRFLRSCVGVCDDFYDRYIVKNQLLKPVFEVFQANGHRDNLINSSVLELVSFLATHRRVLLLEDLMHNHSIVLSESLSYSPAFADARKAYEEIKANLDSPGALAAASSPVGNTRAPDSSNSNGSSGPHGSLLNLTAPAVDDVGTEDVGPHPMMSLDANGNRFGGSFFGHQELRIAPDQDEDEAYFASDDNVGDDGISELSRILEEGRSAIAPNSTNPFEASSSDQHLSSAVGPQMTMANSSGFKHSGERELVSPRRLASLSRSGATGAQSAPASLLGPGQAVGALSSTARAASGHASMGVGFSIGADEDSVMGFDDPILNSTWSNRGPSSSGRGGPLVDYAFDNDSEDMFSTDCSTDSLHVTSMGRSHSPTVHGRSSMTLKWECGDFKETIRGAPAAVTACGGNDGAANSSSGSSGGGAHGTGRVPGHETVSHGNSDGGVDDGKPRGCDGHEGHEQRRGFGVQSADSGDISTSPKKRRRTIGSSLSGQRRIGGSGGGLETSTRWVQNSGGSQARDRFVSDGKHDCFEPNKACRRCEEDAAASEKSTPSREHGVSAESCAPKRQPFAEDAAACTRQSSGNSDGSGDGT